MSADTTTIREATVKYRGGKRQIGSTIRGPSDVVNFLRRVIDDDPREHFIAIVVDGRHTPIAYQVVSVGTATQALVHPRETFRFAIVVGGAGLIVAHNHPSGNVTPSREDLDITRRLVEAGHLLGIQLLDSLVITSDGYYSTQESCASALVPKGGY